MHAYRLQSNVGLVPGPFRELRREPFRGWIEYPVWSLNQAYILYMMMRFVG